jgi:hypothetical protein
MSNFSVYDAQNDLFRLEKNSKKYSKLVGISLFHAALVDAVGCPGTIHGASIFEWLGAIPGTESGRETA